MSKALAIAVFAVLGFAATYMAVGPLHNLLPGADGDNEASAYLLLGVPALLVALACVGAIVVLLRR